MSVPNTHLGIAAIETLLRERRRLWFIGIGGVHMSSLALVCKTRGLQVAGSDAHESERVLQLRRHGIPVCIGQDATNLSREDLVIYTLALSPDNPEYRAALEGGLPMISRAEFLACLTAIHTRRIGIAGSHGKSTVTAMLERIFTEAGRDPTVFCGATLPGSASPVRIGGGKDCIFEACEYGNSFLAFRPTVALILNVEFDHADFFRDTDAILSAFSAFAALPGAGGTLLYNVEDALACKAAASSPARQYSFGISKGDCHASALSFEGGYGRFSLCLMDHLCGEIALRVPGEHNVKNALAAALCAAVVGIPTPLILQALSRFEGAERRMQERGTLCGARVFDDYAHHPTEIAASLTAARQLTKGTGRVFAVFQPHTYTRTAALYKEMCEALSLADRVLVADIYPARERDTLGQSAKRLAEGIGERGDYMGDLDAIADALEAQLRPNDTLVVMGAGDIDRIFSHFSPKHFTLRQK